MAGEVGQAAPEFTLYDSGNQQRKLSEFRGKNVVLAFFPRSFYRRMHHGDVHFQGPGGPA